MTGIRTLCASSQTTDGGKRERREFEYIRHGTQTLIVSFDVAGGQVAQGSVGDTRTEADYLTQQLLPHQRHEVALDHGLLKHTSIGISGAVCRTSRRTRLT